MNPDYSPQTIVSRLGISWRDYRHLSKVAPRGNQDFDTWARRGFSGELIRNMRVRRGLPLEITRPPQKDKTQDDIWVIRQALLSLKLASPFYSDYDLGRDTEGNFALISSKGVYIALGQRQKAYEWLRGKTKDLLKVRKAA